MDEVKIVLKEVVSQRLAAAPDSVAKAELIEELTDNLCCRYADLLASGVEPNEARARVVDALGETDELVEYLKGLEPDQPLPEPLEPEKEDGGQIEEILHNVEDILRGAFAKAKSAFRDVKASVKEGFHTEPAAEEVPEADVEVSGEEPKEERPGGWKVSMGYDSESGKFHAGAGRYQDETHSFEVDSADVKTAVKDLMKDIEGVLRSAADAAKSAYSDVKDAMTPDAPVAADQPISGTQLRGIDVSTAGGGITVCLTGAPDSDVLVGGDIDDIEVFRSEDGVLTIRPVKTETSSFFNGRGIFNNSARADVKLTLPCRAWEFLKLHTANGDVEVSGGGAVDQVKISTVSGDIRGNLPTYAKVACRSTNGDIVWEGDVSGLTLESISGDITYRGRTDSVCARSTSGDVKLEGSVCAAVVKTVSGDVCLRSHVMPDKMEIGTTSGDMWVDIPDGTPFSARFRSTSGVFTSDFFVGAMRGRNCGLTYRGGGQKVYSFSSISGDVELRKI